jgi:hypothetical protein
VNFCPRSGVRFHVVIVAGVWLIFDHLDG